MEMNKQTVAAMVSMMLMGGAGGGGVIDTLNSKAHKLELQHERKTLALELEAKRVEQETRTAAIQKLLEDTRSDAREARETLALSCSRSYEALQSLCMEKCQ